MVRRSPASDTRLSRFTAFLCLVMMLLLPRVGLAQSKVSGGDNFTLLVTDSGDVWSFGYNASGQLGLGHTDDQRSPQQMPGLTNVIGVAAGGHHALAFTSMGSLYAWGNNTDGEVGDGSNTHRLSPQLLSLSNVVAIAAGDDHSLALTSTGDLYSWGEASFGQLGTGSTTDHNTPQLILTGVAAIGAGYNHSLAVKTDGSAWSWGRNSGGQLGNGTVSSGATSTPVQMIGVSGAVGVYGGLEHSVILLSDGTLKAAGQNGERQLGDGTTATQRLTAVTVAGLSNIEAVAVGSRHNLALDDEGRLWVWGDGAKGALGTGGWGAVNPATVLSAPTDVSFIGTAWEHSIAIDANGIVSTWGTNWSGELGDGTTTQRNIPDAISAAGYSWRVATPTFSIAAGTYNIEKSVVVAVDTAGATIRYTVDGSDPTETSSIVSSGASLTIEQSKTLKAKAWKTGMPDSAIQSAAYTLQALTPSITIPSGGPFNSPQNVSMQTGTAGATIRYTLDGTSPTSSSPIFSSTLVVDQTTTFKSATFKTGWSASGVQSGTITFNYGALDAPSIDPATGNYAGTVNVTMSSAQTGATIRYTTNGTTPTASSTLYAGAVPISNTTTVKAKAFHSSYSASGETSRTFTMSAATPTLSAAAGSYAPGSTVTISTTEPTATLRMTIDGNDPTSTSPIVASGTALILGNFTLKVKAFRANVGDSAIASAAYWLTSALGPGAVTSGGSHNVLATPDGRVMVWGNNGNGQLGNESTTDRPTPTVISTITGVTAVASGLAHTLALTSDGRLFAWGSNTNGRLGNGTTTQSTKPVHISTLSNVVAIAAGDGHSLALTGDGRVFSWGLNTNGQLGLGNSGSGTDQNVPTEITGLTNIVAIAAGDSHSFAVTSGGQVFAWGANGNSRLGDGSTTQQNSPLLLSLGNIASIAAGQAHTLALTSGGRIYGWGANTNGQLGIAPATTVATPTLIPNLHASAVFAGDNQSGAIRADGALVMWGSSSSGQVGSGTITATISTPTVISGVSGASSVSLGDLHSVAVTSAGETFAWGESADYRLGNSNSTQDKSSPQSVLTGLTSWAPAPPTIDVASATLTAPTTVTISSTVSDAVIRYTLNGSAPTANDPEVPANGQIEIAYSSLLRARAFVSGRAPSALPGRADYELQSAAPTISPGTGTYSSAQSVTVTANGAPGAIRYTIDGSEPTASSLLYSGNISVSTGMTINAKTFPSNGWASSAVASAALAFDYGTLNAPSASLGSGVYASTQSISLSAQAGASIRYTTDGSAPTASSSLYSSAISIATGTVVLKARAFHSDWSQGNVFSGTYTVDTVAPTISADRFPAPRNNWHNMPTTVSFTCADNVGIASCSAPTTVSNEGAAQTVAGNAIDQAGRETTLNIAVNVDLTPPDVDLTSPTGPSTTNSTSISLAAIVSDSLSGLSTVTCNGQAATVVSGQVNCLVPLHPGINDLTLVAQDAAGNSRSTGVRVIRTGTSTVLTLAPAVQAMRIDDNAILKLTDDFGSLITAATWESNDTGIVSLSQDDPPVLTAVAAGTATITATKGGLSVQATLMVAAGPLVSGDTRWAVNGLFGSIFGSLPANRVDPTVPDMFSLEPGATGTIVRGVTSAGDVQWVAQSPGYPLMADSFGAVVAGLDSPSSTSGYIPWDNFGYDMNRYGGFARFGGPTSAIPWRYVSLGTVHRPAQAADGTIYAIEKYDTGLTDVHSIPTIETQVIVLDGATGYVRARIPLAREIGGYTCGNEGYVIVPLTRGPIVGNDGYGYVLLRSVVNVRSGGCLTGVVSQDVGVKLLRISPTGESSSTSIYSQHCERGFADLTVCDKPPYLADPIPDGVGVLVTGGYTTGAYRNEGNTTYPREGRLTRITSEGIQYDIPTDFSEILMTDGAGRAYVTDQAGLRVINVSDWTTEWSNANASLRPVTGLIGGDVAIFDVNANTMTKFGSDGNAGESSASGWYSGYLGSQTAYGQSTGIEAGSGQLSSRVSLPLDELPGSYNNQASVGTSQHAPRGRQGQDSIAGAALAAFDFFHEHTRSTDWEWGGVICATGTGRFNYSRIVTNNDSGSVRTLDSYGLTPEQVAGLPACAPYGIDAPVGSFHMHTPQGQTEPSGYAAGAVLSGSDLDNAASRPDITFFVLTSNVARTGMVRYMYQAQQVPQDGGGFTWSALSNTFKLVNGQWVQHVYQSR